MLNHAHAAAQLGIMYEQGKGVPQNYRYAVGLYRRSAETGNPTGQYQLGLAYLNGTGVARDSVLAYALFNLAAVSGNEQAIAKRGEMLTLLSKVQLAEGQAIATAWKPHAALPFASRSAVRS
jgi:TPR repeat protein